MIQHYRQSFNANFTEEKYRKQIADIERRSGTQIEFRIAESPIFLPKHLAKQAGQFAEEIIERSLTAELQEAGRKAIPDKWRFGNEPDLPHFAAVDFAICGSKEQPELKLIELQGFPSLYHYQTELGESMKSVYGLESSINGLINTEDTMQSYYKRLYQIIVAGVSPEETVLIDLAPHSQKTKCDFYLAAKHLGIGIADIAAIYAKGDNLYYRDEHGNEKVIKRIYNRSIVDELVRKNTTLQFDIQKDYKVEWTGHPHWYFRISKVLLPLLTGLNSSVPDSYYLSDVYHDTIDLTKYVLKPLYSFAGVGVNIEPGHEDITAIAISERSQWLLQRKVHYAEVIHTPQGNGVRCELRVMLIRDDENKMKAWHTLVRLTRGKMVGVDYNKGLDWVGSSAALVV